MGASNSRPVTSKFTDGEENDIIKYAAPSIQGWRAKMEDVCAAILDLDGSTAFFGVCDGHGGLILFSRKCKSFAHGGNDVALYCARQFHTELAKEAGYHNNLANAMERARLRTDEQLQQSDEWRELANPRGNGNWIQCLKTDVCANLWPSTEVEIGAKKYAKEGAGGERRTANSNSEWDEYEDISSPSSESDNKSKDPDYDPMEIGGAESGDSSGNGSSDNNNSSDGGKDEEEGEEEEEEEDDGDVDYEEEEEETPESQKYRISGTNEFNALNPDHHILEIDPLLPLIDKVSILREGRRRGFYFIGDIAYDEADNYINTHGIEDDSSDDD